MLQSLNTKDADAVSTKGFAPINLLKDMILCIPLPLPLMTENCFLSCNHLIQKKYLPSEGTLKFAPLSGFLIFQATIGKEDKSDWQIRRWKPGERRNFVRHCTVSYKTHYGRYSILTGACEGVSTVLHYLYTKNCSSMGWTQNRSLIAYICLWGLGSQW